jgi:hypothetical protein
MLVQRPTNKNAETTLNSTKGKSHAAGTEAAESDVSCRGRMNSYGAEVPHSGVRHVAGPDLLSKAHPRQFEGLPESGFTLNTMKSSFFTAVQWCWNMCVGTYPQMLEADTAWRCGIAPMQQPRDTLAASGNLIGVLRGCCLPVDESFDLVATGASAVFPAPVPAGTSWVRNRDPARPRDNVPG